MEEETIALVEDYLDDRLQLFGQKWHEIPAVKGKEIGRTVDYAAGRNRYIGYLISLGVYSFKGMKVGLDCANGSAWNIAKAVFDALGAETYVINALALMFRDYPEEIFAARKDSPMILGVEDGESYIASDVPAILKYTRNVYYIGNQELACVKKGEITFYNLDGEEIEKEPKVIEWDTVLS